MSYEVISIMTMEPIMHKLESKLLNIIAEIVPQKGLAANQPGYATFEERVAMIEDFATHSEASLAYNVLIGLLEEGDFTLSATNSLALVWIGIVLECKANDDGSISLDYTEDQYEPGQTDHRAEKDPRSAQWSRCRTEKYSAKFRATAYTSIRIGGTASCSGTSSSSIRSANCLTAKS